MNRQTARTNYLAQLIAIYKNTPSLAIWRALEARAFDNIVFEPPTLDLACGTGHFARILLRNIAITGCDLDENAIKVAAKGKTLDALSVADAKALPYPDRVFNSVLANCALEHILDVAKVIAEVARVLKPMGLFAFTVPSEYFNDSLFIPRLYKLLGLNSRSQRHIQWYNSLQQHYHLDPLAAWEKRLNIVGFKLILHRYYMPRLASFVFSIWDVIAKWTVPPRSGRPIHIQQFLLNRFPNRLLLWILYYHLVGCYRPMSTEDSGSGLLVVARKEADRC
jgi:ubiquinone/menaquinone biosynthesis C-methylase UbiE